MFYYKLLDNFVSQAAGADPKGTGRGMGGEGGSRRRRRRAETPKAWRGNGKGFPLPSRLGGLGSIVSSPAGSRAETRPKTDFGAFQASQNAYR